MYEGQRMWNKKKYIRVKRKKERKKHWKERVEVCVKGRECGIKRKEERNIGRIWRERTRREIGNRFDVEGTRRERERERMEEFLAVVNF